jgi:phage FluMu gp28-like protein
VGNAVNLAPEMSTEERVYKFGTQNLISIYKSNFLEDFQQEQECKFIDSASSYISLELIHENTPGMRSTDRVNPLDDDEAIEESIEIRIAKSPEELINLYNLEIHGTVYLGYDVARRRDASVIYAIGNINNKKKSLAEIVMRNTPFEEQLNIVRSIMNGLPVVRCCMDMTGMGEPLYEILSKEFGDKVEGIPFTAENKEILAVSAKRGLENHEYLLPNIQAFHIQIHSIKRSENLIGRFRYDAERTERGHADSFWAWALASYAITENDAHTPSFYDEWARNKNKGAASHSEQQGFAQSTPVRGKSVYSVLRGIENGYYKK